MHHPEKIKRELPTTLSLWWALRSAGTELDKAAAMLRVTPKCNSGLTRPRGLVEMLIPKDNQWGCAYQYRPVLQRPPQMIMPTLCSWGWRITRAALGS